MQFVVSERFGLNDALVDGRRAGANIEAMDACARTMTPGERARSTCRRRWRTVRRDTFRFRRSGRIDG